MIVGGLGIQSPADAAWLSLSSARDNEAFFSAWLAVLCNQVVNVRAGLLLLGPEQDGAFVPAALWPDHSADLRYLSPYAERVLSERRGLTSSNSDGGSNEAHGSSVIGYPVTIDGAPRGVVVLDITTGSDACLRQASRAIHWASAWIVERIRNGIAEEQAVSLSRLSFALDLSAEAMDGSRAMAALAIVNRLAARLQCDSVSIGFLASEEIEVNAVSNTAVFDRRMDPIRRLADAMDETVDLGATIILPPKKGDELDCRCHKRLAQDNDDVAICSVPLMRGERTIGVLVCERRSLPVFDHSTVAQIEAVGSMLGPIFALHEAGERSVTAALRHKAKEYAAALFGPLYPGTKAIGLCLLLLAAGSALMHGTYRVTAKAVTEGLIQQAAIAPFDGHIAGSFARAGDIVAKGQPLCSLDDRELQLDLLEQTADRERAAGRERAALATNDRAAMAEAQAQVLAADARIALSSDRLARAKVVAPFDGIVVSGDLSQLGGTPVQQGKLLFQIAPLDSYRLILEVDERDIANVDAGLSGELTLASVLGEHFQFSVLGIMPVTTQSDGRNFFRVEARLTSTPKALRPGMEGVGKITIGPRRLLWIWTHGLTDWLRLWVWKNLF